MLLDEGDEGDEGGEDADVVAELGAGLADVLGLAGEGAAEVAAPPVTVKLNVSDTGCPSSEVTFQSTR